MYTFYEQDWWDGRLEAAGYGFWLSYVPKVLLAIVIALMDEAYFKVAVWLNDLGEHRIFLSLLKHFTLSIYQSSILELNSTYATSARVFCTLTKA